MIMESSMESRMGVTEVDEKVGVKAVGWVG